MKDYLILVLGEKKDYPDFLQAYDLTYEHNAFYDLLLDLNAQTISLASGIKHHYQSQDELKGLMEILFQKLQKLDFNPQTGAQMLGGSEKLFMLTLQRYLDNYEDLEAEMKNWLRYEDFASIREAIHKIKGFSLYLGSSRLHDVGTLLEETLANGKHDYEGINYFLKLHRRISKYCQEQVKNV